MAEKTSIFELGVLKDFLQNPEESSFLIEGYYGGKLEKRIASRDLVNKGYEFDGYRLDTLRAAMNIKTQEDVDNLVRFLLNAKYCLPKHHKPFFK